MKLTATALRDLRETLEEAKSTTDWLHGSGVTFDLENGYVLVPTGRLSELEQAEAQREELSRRLTSALSDLQALEDEAGPWLETVRKLRNGEHHDDEEATDGD